MKKVMKTFTFLALIITGVLLIDQGASMAFSQSTRVQKDRKGWLSRGNMYVEYDFGTWRPNDDAFLKAEIYGDGYDYSQCWATANDGQTTGYDEGKYAIVEFSGVDYFDAGSYSQTKNNNGTLYLEVE
ncbi:hypothetical protein [uncultured Murdochiella sp.]|uniref:hypothetical protein n=1 Tax=uncultured Murdochiella sp. TaxID=1586095 RepID=UPI0028045644|nr:hypothetical protein [uncultured Murdochiella sp.]